MYHLYLIYIHIHVFIIYSKLFNACILAIPNLKKCSNKNEANFSINNFKISE